MYLGRVPFVLAVAVVVHHVAGALIPPFLERLELVVVGFSVLLELSRFFLHGGWWSGVFGVLVIPCHPYNQHTHAYDGVK